jgi:hypothetical protein
MIITFTGAVVSSSFKPSCSCSAVKSDGSAGSAFPGAAHQHEKIAHSSH